MNSEEVSYQLYDSTVTSAAKDKLLVHIEVQITYHSYIGTLFVVVIMLHMDGSADISNFSCCEQISN